MQKNVHKTRLASENSLAAKRMHFTFRWIFISSFAGSFSRFRSFALLHMLTPQKVLSFGHHHGGKLLPLDHHNTLLHADETDGLVKHHSAAVLSQTASILLLFDRAI